MIPLVSIIGRSNSGKTYLIEKLVSALTAKGYCIATVKHTAHGFDIDQDGKDSWRHKQAGASTVVLAAPDKIAVFKSVEKEIGLEEIQRSWIKGVDLILAEGFKREGAPKIQVSLFEDSGELLCGRENQLVAVVSNKVPGLADVPVFLETEMNQLVQWLEDNYINIADEPKVEIMLDGRPVTLTPFLQKLIRNTWRGLLSSLKGWNSQGEVEIRISGEPEGDPKQE